MPRLEAPLAAWAVAWARFRGIVTAKLTQCDGIQDNIFFIPGGRPILVEFKRKGKLGKGLQLETQPWYKAKLQAEGYTVVTIDTKEQFRELMKEYAQCKPGKSKTSKLKI